MPSHLNPGVEQIIADIRADLTEYSLHLDSVIDLFTDPPTPGCPLCGAPTTNAQPCTRRASVGAPSCADVIAADVPLVTANTGPHQHAGPIPATLRRNTLALVGDGAVWLGTGTWQLDPYRAATVTHPDRAVDPHHRTTANRVLPMLHDWVTLRLATRVGLPADSGAWPLALTAAGWNLLDTLEYPQR